MGIKNKEFKKYRILRIIKALKYNKIIIIQSKS